MLVLDEGGVRALDCRVYLNCGHLYYPSVYRKAIHALDGGLGIVCALVLDEGVPFALVGQHVSVDIHEFDRPEGGKKLRKYNKYNLI